MNKKNINNISIHNNNTRFKNRQRRNAERLKRSECALVKPIHHITNPHDNSQIRPYVTPYICSKSFAEIVDHKHHVSHTRPTFTHMLPIARPTTVSACTTPNILKIHQKCYLDPAFNKQDLHKTHEMCEKVYMDTPHGKSDNTPNIYIINNLGDKPCNSEQEHKSCIPDRNINKQQRIKRKQQRLKRKQCAEKHLDEFGASRSVSVGERSEQKCSGEGGRFYSGRGSRRNSENNHPHNHCMVDSRLDYLDDPRMNSDYDQSYNHNHYYCGDPHHCCEPEYEMQYDTHCDTHIRNSREFCSDDESDEECDDDESYDESDESYDESDESYDESDEECDEESEEESVDCDTDNETLDNSQSDNTECDHSHEHEGSNDTHEHGAPDDTFTKLMKNLYHEVGDAIKCILKAFAQGSGNLDNLLEYENYSALSDKLYALKCENNVHYERFRNILIDAVEGAKKNNNRIGEQDDAYKTLKKLYDDLLETKRKGPSLLSAEVQLTTVAVIRPEIIEYIRRGYKLVNDKNEQIPLDMDVLAEIRKELHIHSEPCNGDEGEHHHAE